MTFTDKLYSVMQKMNKNEKTRFIIDLVYKTGLVDLYDYFEYKKDKKHPTQVMLDAKKFFEENKERVQKNITQLNDSCSKEIYKKAIQYRITHDSKNRPDFNRFNQYFSEDIIKITPNEVFVDCGAYIGDTINTFIKYATTGGGYARIVAFEPDINNSRAIKAISDKIEVVEAAVWNEDTELIFDDGNDGASKVSDIQHNGTKVKAMKIDSVKACENATFIKMDIEGAEYNALLGAFETIKRNRPKLAICIYHSDEDMVRLQELIDSWNLGYEFYIRHHAYKTSETVLYAICNNK